MAQQTINIGSAANAGDGEPLRDAFDKVNDNFDEIYDTTSGSEFVTTDKIRNDAVDSDQIASGAIDEDHLNATNSPTAGHMLTYDSGGGFTWAVPGDITGIIAGNGLFGDATSGDASLGVGQGDGIQVTANEVSLASSVAGSGLTYTAGVLSVDEIDTDGIGANAVTPPKLEKFDDALAATDGHILVADGTDFTNVAVTGVIDITNAGVTSFDSTVAGNGILNTSGVLSLDVDDSTVEVDDTNGLQIKDDGVDHDQLADRYTAVQTITTTSGTINLDASSYTTFRLTSDLTGATTLNIQNMKNGQVIDITVSGSQTITFSSDDTSETFNKVGGVDYDGAEDNHIQVVCIDETNSAAIYNYSIGTYTSDTTP